MGNPPPPPDSAWALFLDVDGTLIDIASTPSAIEVPSGLPALLEAVWRRHGGALALVSGRALDNLARLTAPFRPPAAGLHGLERRGADGGVIRPPPLPGLDLVRDALIAFADRHPGVIVEDKELSLALHYRLAPELADDCRKAAWAAASLAAGLTVATGKMVFELRPKGADKGSAVRAFMAEVPFAGRVPLFAGDDLTDEDGFKAANALGGYSLLVGRERPTAATWRLGSEDAFRRWLASSLS